MLGEVNKHRLSYTIRIMKDVIVVPNVENPAAIYTELGRVSIFIDICLIFADVSSAPFAGYQSFFDILISIRLLLIFATCDVVVSRVTVTNRRNIAEC